MAYGYEKDIDYKTLMENAAKSGDMARAAIFEAQNNERINGEGLPVQQTSLYSQYLPAQQSVNPYQQELEKTMNGATVDYLLGGDAISAYKKAYLREADRTGRDTLGQYATMTGGIPSTQAVAAASQAADYQKSKLAEQLPSLYQQQIDAAMNRWKELGAADERVAQILGVQVGALTADQAYQNWNRKMQEDQFAWQKEQQARSDSYSLALTLLQSGQMPSDDLLTAAGISRSDAQKILSAAQSAAYSRSSSGGGSSSSKLKTVGYNERQELLAKVNKGGMDSILAEMAYYQAAGYDYNELYNWLMQYATFGGAQNGSGSGSSYGGGYSGVKKTASGSGKGSASGGGGATKPGGKNLIARE